MGGFTAESTRDNFIRTDLHIGSHYTFGSMVTVNGNVEKRLRPERGAQSPRESERGWGPASI